MLERSQFVGRGEGAGDKGAVQGCSEFNPVFLLSQAENAAYAKTADHTERDAKNAPNRRVMVLLFAPDAPVTAASWPCPRWNESTAGCKAEFWPDGEERRTAGTEERRYGKGRGTMACQWYDSFVRLSPCEGRVEHSIATYSMRLTDTQKNPMGFTPVRVHRMSGVMSMKTDKDGWVTLSGRPQRVRVEWTWPTLEKEEHYLYAREVLIGLSYDDAGDDGRLANLGFNEPGRQTNVRAYQRQFGLYENGSLDDIREDLRKFHDGDPRPETN